MRKYYLSARQFLIDRVAGIPFGIGDFVMNSEFTRNVMKLSTGSIIVTALSFLITPINTRLFSPEDYGLANMIAMVSSLLGVLLSFNLNPVILMEKHQRVADATATLSLVLLPISLLVSGGLLFLSADHLLPILNAEPIRPYLWLVFIMLGISGLSNIFMQMIQRKKQYGLMSKINVTSSLLGHAIRLPWGFLAPSFKALYISSVIAFIPNIFWGLRHGGFRLTSKLKYLRMVLAKNATFMLHQTTYSIITVVSVQLPLIWVAAKCSMAEVGYFTMAVVLVDVPCNLILNSFQTVYYKRVADIVNSTPEMLPSLIRRNIFKLLKITVIPLLLMVLVLPFTTYILGSRWEPLIPILQGVILLRYPRFVNTPVIAVLVVLRKNFFYVFTSIGWLILTFLALFVGNDNLVFILLLLSGFVLVQYSIVYFGTHLIIANYLRRS